MELTRSNITKYLNDGYLNSTYYKKVKTPWLSKDELDKAGVYSVADLDFLECLKVVFFELKENYDSFISNPDWAISLRQNRMLEYLKRYFAETEGNNKNVIIRESIDFYWTAYDYFHDYGNKNETLCKEEIDLVLPLFVKFFDEI